jgi:uncharacterized protein YunC (DUF1805 family)
MAVTNDDLKPFIHVQNAHGRILVGNSLTSYEAGEYFTDVLLGASFAGAQTGKVPLRQGAKGWIAHEAGPGLDDAGISGLPLADSFNVPAAAIATSTAALSNGPSLLTGTVSRANQTAALHGVQEGMCGEQAAYLMLQAPDGRLRNVDGLTDESTQVVKTNENGSILRCWSFSRVMEEHPNDVFLVASHGAKIMALYALRIRPRGLICNDAGFGLDNSGIEGIFELEKHCIPAATVSTHTARIGDPESTYGGTISAVNSIAANLGVTVGMKAKTAADLMLLS